jgi:S1-C subfamily serine protease
VIVGVGNQKVTSPAEAARLVHEALSKNHAVALRIMHDGQTVFVAIEPGKDG